MISRKLTIWLAIVALVALALPLYGQANFAMITGSVTDPQGAVVPNVPVIAKNVDTNIEYKTTTTGQGLYTITNLPPGTYDVRVEAGSNFSKAEVKAIKLQVGDRRDLSMKLALAGVSTEVVVTTQAPLLESTKTEVASVISDRDMQNLPFTGGGGLGSGTGNGTNDYASIAASAPGVRFDYTGNSADVVGPGAVNFRENNFTVDGSVIYHPVDSGRATLGASIDEIQEMQVLTNNYNAEYGQAGGVILNVVTKSGTNAIHGDYHGFWRGTNMQSANYLYNLSCNVGTSSNPLCPIGSNPLFPGVGSPGPDQTGVGLPHFFKHENGFTLGGPFIKDKLFWFVSLEKTLSGSPETFPFPPGASYTVTQPDDELLWTGKIDWQVTTGNHFNGRFNEYRQTLGNLFVQTPQEISPEALNDQITHTHIMTLRLTSAITPRFVNEATVSWNWFATILNTKTTNPGILFSDAYTGADFCCPQGEPHLNRWTGSDNMTWTVGRHTFKWGGSLNYIIDNSDLFSQFFFGQWDNSTNSVNSPIGCVALGCPGGPTSFTVGLSGVPGQQCCLNNMHDNIWAGFFQDTWKWRSNLTVNYGLRYDYEAGAFRGGTVSDGHGGCLQRNLIVPACSSDANNWQPRLGIAWAPHFQGTSGFMHALLGDPDKSLISVGAAEITQLAFLNVSLDSLNFDGVNLQTVGIDCTDTTSPLAAAEFAACSAYPNRPSVAALAPFAPPCNPSVASSLTLHPCGRIRPISPGLHNPEIHDLNLSIQRQIGKDWAVNVQYVGGFGSGEFGEADTNFPTVSPDPAHPGFFYFSTGRPDERFLAIRTNTNSRTYQYHGVIFDVEKRLSHHIQFDTNYTFSKLLASSEDFYGTSEPGDPNNIRAEKGPSQNNVPQVWNYRFLVDTNKMFSSTWAKWLFNDWSFGYTGTAQSGHSYPISTGTGPFKGDRWFGINGETSQVPNVGPDGTINAVNIASYNGGTWLIGPNGATACGCPQTTFLAPASIPGGAVDTFTGDAVDFQSVNGNIGKNKGIGSAFWRSDVSLKRSFRLKFREGMSVSISADAFNVFNHTNWIGFNGQNMLSITSGAFAPWNANGQYVDPNNNPVSVSTFQNGNVSHSPYIPVLQPFLGGMGDGTAVDIPRQFQLGLRVRF